MNDQPPRRRRSASRSHWYSQAAPVESTSRRSLSPSTRRGSARERARRRREDSRQLPAPNWTWGVLAVTGIGIIGVLSLLMIIASGGQQDPSPTATKPPAVVVNPTASPLPTIDVRPWDGKQRYTIIIMGLDKRPGEADAGSRTDTMILISVDPATKSVGMLSIPRDLFVPIPGQSDMQRINAAYALGELRQPGSGPRLVMQTIQYNFGMTVNSYVMVSFDAVIGLVDAIGGIDIDVPKTIDDPEYPDMNYGFDPLYISAGQTHMDGKLALKYARTRHQDSDYDRTARQQAVILAIRQKAIKPEVLGPLASQAPALWEKLHNGVITDFTFDKALSLGWFLKDIPAANIHRGTIQDKYAQASQYQGDTIITPNRALLAELLTQVFGPNYNK